MRRRRPLSRVLRTVEVTALVLAASVAPIGSAARADTAVFGGLSLGTSGAPVFFTYNQASVPIPATPTFEFSVAHSESDLSNGTGHALASVAWPGNTAANFPSALHDLGVPPDVPTPPNYPVRAETFFPTSEGQKGHDVNDAGAVKMESESTDGSASASARSADAPGLVSTGSASSDGVSKVDGKLAFSEIHSSVNDVDIFGVIKIDKVKSWARAESDAKTGKVSGITVVTGLTIGGQGYTVDEKGMHMGEPASPSLLPPLGGLLEPITKQLVTAAGIDMHLTEPIDVVNGASASRTAGALIISFTPKTLAAKLPAGLLSGLPPQVPPALTQFDQVMTITLGAVAASASAAPPADLPAAPPVAPPPAVPPVDTGTAPVDVPVAPAPEVVAAAPVAAPGPPLGKAIPWILTVFGLLMAAGTSRVLRHVADKAVADVPVDVCPLESR